MKTKSIWGAPPKRLYKLIDLAEETLKKDFTSTIVGCSDGKFLMPFARKGHMVTGYDIDKIAIYGGYKDFPIRENSPTYKYCPEFKSKEFKLENKKVLGVVERIKLEKLEQFTQVEYLDFYKHTPKDKYDVVFTSCSLHYSVNKDFSLKEKIKKLQSIVNVNGLLYIDYMMAINEEDLTIYPPEKFFRKGQIKNCFDSDWQILHLKENDMISFEAAHVDCVKDHFHRFGYILARRVK